MWGAKRRRIAELEARVEQLVQQRDAAREDAAAHLGAAKRTAARNVHLSDQLDGARALTARHQRRISCLARAVASLRVDLSVQHRVVDRLTEQLFSSLGYTDTGLEALGVAIAKQAKEHGEVQR